MAIVIKADCPQCGVVRLGAGDLTVRVCTDDGSGGYCFRCGDCGTAVQHDASAPVCELLVSAGVERVDWHWPDELADRPDGPSFTTDDLLDFHLLMRREDDWSQELASLSREINSTPG